VSEDALLFELGEELRRHQDQNETIQFDALASQFGVEEADVRDCMAAMQALEQACGEDLPPEVDAPPPLEPPELPADYELLQELGQGGMGVVYRARQRSLDRAVAVKVLRPGDRQFGDMLARFEREAQTLARLNHPHVVPIHEVGHAGEHLYFSMALIEGTNLAELLSRESLNPARAVAILEQVSDAVAYVHAQGVVHRDLKPANVLLDESGSAYVVDFGLAVEQGAEGLTATGHVVGTPAYMSPEQAKADRERVGEASDVYALGAILFECLTGQPPFRRGSLGETLHAVIHDDPPRPRSLNPRVPPELEAVALKALAKDPALRYPSAAALREDLRRFAQGEPVQAKLPSRWTQLRAWGRRNPGRAIVAAQLALVALALLAWGTVELVQWRRAVAAHQRLMERDFEDRQERTRADNERNVEPDAARGNVRAKVELAWSRATGRGYAQDLPRALEELAELAKAGHPAAVVGYVFLLQRGYRVAPFDVSRRDGGWSDAQHVADDRGLDERDTELWARERARILDGAENGEGWALWVRGELTRPADRAFYERPEERPQLLEVAPRQAVLDLVEAVSSPAFAFSWRDPWTDPSGGHSNYGGLFVPGPFAEGAMIALRNPALVIRQALLDDPQLGEAILERLEAACDAGSVGAASTLLRSLGESSAQLTTPRRPQLLAKALAVAVDRGAQSTLMQGLDPAYHEPLVAAVRDRANAGSWRACLWLAARYEQGGYGLEKDETELVALRRRALSGIELGAERGDWQALRELGFMHKHGHLGAPFGLEEDETEAERLLAKSRERMRAEANAHR